MDTVIDLGVLPTAGADDPPPPPAPAASRPRWPVGWVAAGLGVLVLLTATASAPQPPWAVPHFTVPTSGLAHDDIVLTEDTLYVVGQNNTGTSESTIAAYRLTDGTLRWQQSAGFAHVWNGEPVVTWNGEPGGSDVRGSEGSGGIVTAWLDPRTGEPWWQGEGEVRAVFDDLALIVTPHLPPYVQTDDTQWWRSSLAVIDRDSGRERWSLPPVDDWTYSMPASGPPDRLVTLQGDRLSSYDFGTGRRLATTELSAVRQFSALQVIGRIAVLISQRDPTRATLTAYDVDSFDQLWSQESEPGIVEVAWCGQLVCMYRRELAGVAALDPATGAQRWSRPLSPTDSVDLQWLEGYLVVNNREDESYRLLDAATGEEVFELGTWSPHHGDAGDALVASYDPTEEELFRELGRTWFARLHPDPAPRLEFLGVVDNGFGNCTSGTGYLACTGPEEVTVWRVP